MAVAISGVCLVAEGAVLAQLVATRAVWGAHHVLVLWPFPQAAAALAAALAWGRLAGGAAPRLRPALVTGLLLGAAATLAGQAAAGLRYERRIYGSAPTPNPLFTTDVYALSAWVNARLPRVASVITADWGMRYPLRTLAPAAEREKVRDLWLVFREFGKGDGRAVYKEWFEGRPVIVLSYHPERPVFPAADTNWRAFAAKHLEPRGPLFRTALGTYEMTCLGPDAAAAAALCAIRP